MQKLKQWAAIIVPLSVIFFAILLSQLDSPSPAAAPSSISWPTAAYARKVKGDQLYLKNDFKGACDAYEAAYELLEKEKDESLNRHFAMTANNIANMKKRMHKMPEALEWYKAGHEKDPSHFETIYNFANTLLKLENTVLAEGYFRKALAIKPNHPMTIMGLASVLRRNEVFEESKSLMEKAMKLDPKNPDVLANMGLQYMAEKNIESAVEVLTKATEMGHAGAKEQLSRLLQAMERMQSKLKESSE